MLLLYFVTFFAGDRRSPLPERVIMTKAFVFAGAASRSPTCAGGILSVGVTVFFAFVLEKETLSVALRRQLSPGASL